MFAATPAWQSSPTQIRGIRPDAAPALMHPTASDQQYRAPMTDAPTSGTQRLGRLIREAREARGWSQVKLATEAKVGRATVQRYELGTVPTPDPDTVRPIFRALELDYREAIVALGFITREEVGLVGAPQPPLTATEREVIQTLKDPSVPAAQKEQWVNYLRYLRTQSQRASKSAG